MVRYLFEKNLKKLESFESCSSSDSEKERDFFSIVVHTSIAETSSYFESENIEYFIVPEDE